MADEVDRRDEHEAHPGDHPFWPTHVLDEVMIAYALIALILTLAILRPFGLHGPADPLHTPEAIKPEWYFLATYQFLKYVPKVVGVLTVGAFIVCMLFWPFIDGALHRRLGHRKVSTAVGWLVLVVVALLTLLGRISETEVELFGHTVHFDYLGLPHGAPPGAEEGAP